MSLHFRACFAASMAGTSMLYTVVATSARVVTFGCESGIFFRCRSQRSARYPRSKAALQEGTLALAARAVPTFSSARRPSATGNKSRFKRTCFCVHTQKKDCFSNNTVRDIFFCGHVKVFFVRGLKRPTQRKNACQLYRCHGRLLLILLSPAEIAALEHC